MVKNLNLKFSFFLLLSFFYHFNINAQEKDSIFFAINFKWNSEKFELNKNYISNKDTLQINLIKFYISNIQFNYSDGTNYKIKNSYYLIDFENENSKIFSIPKNNKNKISKIIFNIGIDSTASTSGAMNGDLDVTKGMYWAWQSGYINMKIEGKSKSCKTRKNAFQFHIGGYLNPFYAMKTIAFDTIDHLNIDTRINLICDLKPFFNEINLSDENSIMIPGEQAMKLANQSIKMFSIE